MLVRKLETMLKEEIFKKKSLFLYVPHNTNKQLCFAISLAIMIDPGLLCNQVVQLARELHLAGLNDQTPADIGHIHKFKKKRQIQKWSCFTEARRTTLFSLGV